MKAIHTILLADGQIILVEALRALLGSCTGFKVVGSTRDGPSLVQLVVRLRPAVAVVGIDLEGFSGIEATRQIRKLSPATRVLILTGHRTPEYVYEALKAGAEGYLLKECCGSSQLQEAIRALAKGRRFICEQTTGILAAQIASGHPMPQSLVESLSERERQVLRLTAEGKSGAEAASELGISAKTVESYRSRIKRKLEIHDVPGLVKFAIRQGLVSLES
jgi:DNA-binding NarL/FixJ family response regulator